MRNQFITQNNLKELVRDAMNVYVASAYLQKSVIDDIKAVLNELPNKGGRLFRFLLDKEFNPEPQLRQVLINKLLDLPNTEVRIYNGKRLFHAKVYIFESGNRLCTTVGSFNATAGGAGANIEAGVQLTDRELHRQAKAFFEQYWTDPNTEVAQRDDSAVYTERRFQPGDGVILRETSERGVVLNEAPEFRATEREWYYAVLLGQTSRKIAESRLEPLRITSYDNEWSFQGGVCGVREWFLNHILDKVGEQTDNTIASLASTRTALFPYQFRPLFKILRADRHRLLIADEVGLGKTIEAGIILKELTVRKNIDRVLIVVPNSLKTKWRDELQIRFDEYFDILSGGDVAAFLHDCNQANTNATIRGIVTYDQLLAKPLRKLLDHTTSIPTLDLVIIDEAHWLKNEETLRHRVVRRLTQNADTLVMLTATPIQIDVADLFNLISVLVPDHYISLDRVGFSASLTVNERINRAIHFLRQKQFEFLRAVVDELTTKRIFRRDLERMHNYEGIIERCRQCDSSWGEAELAQLAADLYGLNVLSQYVSRTLRKDVADKFPDRKVVTWEYSYSESERQLYDAIVKACRERCAAEKKGSFAAITPERRAASCLVAMQESVLDWKVATGEYLETMDDDEEVETAEGDGEASGQARGAWEAAARAVRRCPVPETDSKLAELKNIIDQAFAASTRNEDKKVMVFCIFKATIKYLHLQLAPVYADARIETLTGDDDIDERDEKKNRFAQNDKPAIMICSEVAGEGLDFQFCHYLVNYDMPWNPSKLEQRAGRIDRMGQQASVVTIINLVNKHTIEDHIMAKLFERVRLFSNTLGPLGEVLSGYQREFTKLVLSQDRSEAARQEYERRVLANVENKMKEQQRFEQEQVELFGAADYFYHESRRQRGHFSENELRLIWDTYMGDAVARVTRAGDVFSIPIDLEVRQKLLTALGQRGQVPFNSRKEKHYKTLVATLAEQGKPLEYTFSQSCALARLDVQFLNVAHPFMQGAIQSISADHHPNRNVLCCRTASRAIAPGIYLLCLYRFSIVDSATTRVRCVEEHVLTLDISAGSGAWGAQQELFDAMIDSAEDAESAGDLPSILERLRETRERLVQENAGEILRDFEQLDNVTRNGRKISLMRQYAAIIAKKKRDLTFRHSPQDRENLAAEIADEKRSLDTKLEELEVQTLRISVRCTGIIHLINQEERHRD